MRRQATSVVVSLVDEIPCRSAVSDPGPMGMSIVMEGVSAGAGVVVPGWSSSSAASRTARVCCWSCTSLCCISKS